MPREGRYVIHFSGDKKGASNTKVEDTRTGQTIEYNLATLGLIIITGLDFYSDFYREKIKIQAEAIKGHPKDDAEKLILEIAEAIKQEKKRDKEYFRQRYGIDIE